MHKQPKNAHFPRQSHPKSKIMIIRKATPADAAAIARNILAAMDFDAFAEPLPADLQPLLAGLTDICAREDTLYSWRNTLVAEDDGLVTGDALVAGSLTSYDGGKYLEMRDLTFALIRESSGWTPPLMDDETRPGEWYLDSLAIHPAYRKRGISRILIERTLAAAAALGFPLASLIALASAPRLISLYASCGFRPDTHLNCFGHTYLRMIQDLV